MIKTTQLAVIAFSGTQAVKISIDLPTHSEVSASNHLSDGIISVDEVNLEEFDQIPE